MVDMGGHISATTYKVSLRVRMYVRFIFLKLPN
jgi:hypothetical protein